MITDLIQHGRKLDNLAAQYDTLSSAVEQGRAYAVVSFRSSLPSRAHDRTEWITTLSRLILSTGNHVTFAGDESILVRVDRPDTLIRIPSRRYLLTFYIDEKFLGRSKDRGIARLSK